MADPVPPPRQPAAGTAAALGAGRYLVEGHLGAGSGGEVFAARDTLLERPVAIKRLPFEFLAAGSDEAEAAEAAARLLAEARALARLVHPHIVAVHDAFEEEGRLHVVMERIDGPTLRQHLDAHGPLPIADLARLAGHLAGALACAHAQGIVHRDLKPENVLLAPAGAGGAAKLVDFGISAAAHRARLTLPGLALGTPAYVAPEQALGQAVDGRADLYALGCLLYEAATGAPPFAGDDPLLVVSQHLHATPAPPRVGRPDLPAAWEALLLRLLAKRPDDRPPSAEGLGADLAALAASGESATPGGHAALGAAPRHNLPAQLTSFVGRERELAAVAHQLSTSRLVTLTGPGGTGKTRLGLQVAAVLQAEYPDGVWLVELAPLADPGLLPQAVSAAVGVREEAGGPQLATLADMLAARRLLLVLDNCEHLIDACARLADALLRAGAGVSILATSREALGIAGEAPFRVPSLELPDPQHLPPIGALAQVEAVRLFADRAAVVRPGFAVTERNAVDVVEICRRLDGIPLALELAAARVRVLPVAQLLARLEDRFRLLTGGSRTALERHQTLQAAVDWSYDLLEEPERRLFDRLSVFAGGFTLEAAEQVCGGAGIEALDVLDVLDLLTRLVDKSLVLAEEQPDGDARYRLLQTLRQYGQQKLAAAGDAAAVRDGHAAYFLVETEARAARVRGAAKALVEGEFAWFAREHDNLRAALGWLRDRGDAERGLRLGAFLGAVWVTQGHLNEGRARLAELLTLPAAQAPTGLRARALVALARLIRRQGDYAAARLLFAESLAVARAAGDRQEEVWALFHLANLALIVNDLEAAGGGVEAMLAAAAELGDPNWQADADRLRGLIALQRREYATARAHLEAALAAWRARGSRLNAAYVLVGLGRAALGQGDRTAAGAHLAECLATAREYGDETMVADALEGIAGLAAGVAGPEWAARLAGAAAALRAAIGAPRGPAAAARLEQELAPARQALGAERYGAAWVEGQAMPVEQAVAVALKYGAGE